MSSNCDQQQQHDRGDEHQNGHQKTRFEVRNEALELNRKRNQLENEIKDFMAILQSVINKGFFQQTNSVCFLKQGVGMTESLVDSEGFPRNDIDINLIRTARNRIICKYYPLYLAYYSFHIYIPKS